MPMVPPQERSILEADFSSQITVGSALVCVGGCVGVCVCVLGVGVYSIPMKRRKKETFTRNMERFSDFINDNEFIDLPLSGRKFTWSNRQQRAAMSRIDHVLILRIGMNSLQVLFNRLFLDFSLITVQSNFPAKNQIEIRSLLGLTTVGCWIRISWV